MATNEQLTSTYIAKFRYWCQKILPAVFDDSLSYYELLCKVIAKLNEVIEVANMSKEAWDAIYDELTRVEQESKDRDDALQKDLDDKVDNLQEQVTSNDEDIANLQKFYKEFYNEYTVFVDDVNKRFENIASLMLCYDPTTGRYTDSANAMRRMLQLFINTDTAYTCKKVSTMSVNDFAKAGTCGDILNKDFQYNKDKMPLHEVEGHSLYDLSQLTLEELDVDELKGKPEVVIKKPRTSVITYGKLIVGLLGRGIGVIKGE